MQVTTFMPLEKTDSSCYPHYFIKIYTKYKTSEEEIRFIEEKNPPDGVNVFCKKLEPLFNGMQVPLPLKPALYVRVSSCLISESSVSLLRRLAIVLSPGKIILDDFLSFSKFGCTWHSPNKFVLCPRLHEFSAPRGGMGISASLLRSIFSFNLRLRAGLRPLPTATNLLRRFRIVLSTRKNC